MASHSFSHKDYDRLVYLMSDRKFYGIYTTNDNSELRAGVKRYNAWRKSNNLRPMPAKCETMTLHDLRHTSVYLAMAKHATNAELCQKFGWSEIPDTYKHFDENLAESVAEKLAAM